MTEKETALIKTEPKLPINIDFSKGISPVNYNELLQFASLYKGSGLAPKSFIDTQQVAIAMAMCIEVGRPIITGIQDMAVINGRVGIFGDAAIAMVRGSGLLELFREWSIGEPYKEGWNFFCLVKRKGEGNCEFPKLQMEGKCKSCEGIWGCGFVGGWTWVESIRAGFDKADKHLPWIRFTRRMMQFKARNFILRDKFGDVLKGIKTVEEIGDIIDVTPEPANKTTVSEVTNGQATAADYTAEKLDEKEEQEATLTDAEKEHIDQVDKRDQEEEKKGTKETDAQKEEIAKIGNMRNSTIMKWAKKIHELGGDFAANFSSPGYEAAFLARFEFHAGETFEAWAAKQEKPSGAIVHGDLPPIEEDTEDPRAYMAWLQAHISTVVARGRKGILLVQGKYLRLGLPEPDFPILIPASDADNTEDPTNGRLQWLADTQEARKIIGDKAYFDILENYGMKSINDVDKNKDSQDEVLSAFQQAVDEMNQENA